MRVVEARDDGQMLYALTGELHRQRFLSRLLASTSPKLLTAVERELRRDAYVVVANLHPSQIDEIDALAELLLSRILVPPFITLNGGKVLSVSGVQVLATFSSPIRACESVALCMEALGQFNKLQGKGKRVGIGFGLEHGRVLVLPGEPAEAYGTAVDNARDFAQVLAAADELVVSQTVAIDVGAMMHQQLRSNTILDRIHCEPCAPLDAQQPAVAVALTRLADHDVKPFRLLSRLNLDRAKADTWLARVRKLLGFIKMPRELNALAARGLEDLVLMYCAADDAIDMQRAGLEAHEIRSALVTHHSRDLTVLRTCLPLADMVTKKMGIGYQLRHSAVAQSLLPPLFGKHKGAVLDTAQGRMVVVFKEPQAAIDAALDCLGVLDEFNASVNADDPKLLVSIGIHTGVMFAHNHELFGYEAIVGEWLCHGTREFFAGPSPVNRVFLSESVVEGAGEDVTKVAGLTSAEFQGERRLIYTIPRDEEREGAANQKPGNGIQRNRTFGGLPTNARARASGQLSRAHTVVNRLQRSLPKPHAPGKKEGGGEGEGRKGEAGKRVQRMERRRSLRTDMARRMSGVFGLRAKKARRGLRKSASADTLAKLREKLEEPQLIRAHTGPVDDDRAQASLSPRTSHHNPHHRLSQQSQPDSLLLTPFGFGGSEGGVAAFRRSGEARALCAQVVEDSGKMGGRGGLPMIQVQSAQEPASEHDPRQLDPFLGSENHLSPEMEPLPPSPPNDDEPPPPSPARKPEGGSASPPAAAQGQSDVGAAKGSPEPSPKAEEEAQAGEAERAGAAAPLSPGVEPNSTMAEPELSFGLLSPDASRGGLLLSVEGLMAEDDRPPPSPGSVAQS